MKKTIDKLKQVCYNKDNEREVITMTMTFTVYDNNTNKIICSDVDWDTAEEYVDNDNYTVVNNLNGMFM